LAEEWYCFDEKLLMCTLAVGDEVGDGCGAQMVGQLLVVNVVFVAPQP
jgi:hypothetical protein